MTRYVYDFDEPADGGRELLGGKGIGLAEMTAARRSRSGRLHDHDRRLPRVHASRGGLRAGSRTRSTRAHRAARGADRQALRRPGRPAARLRALGRRGLDAGDDGHDPQPRPERRRGRGPRAHDRQRGVRARLLPAAHPDVRRDGRRHRARSASAAERLASSAPRRDLTSQDDDGTSDFPQDARDQLRRAVAAVFESWNRRARRSTGARTPSRDDIGTAVNVVQMVFGNKGDGSATGVASRATRRPASRALRRVPRQRAGRGRRRRHPHAAADRGDARAPAGGVRPAPRDDGARSSTTTATCRTSSSRSRTARSTSCRRARRSAPPRPRIKAAADMATRG